MINRVRLKNFKSHENSEINLKKLSIFSGINGVGKSTVIQSLLLLRETYIKYANFEYLDLNTNSIKIGTVKDILYQTALQDEIKIELHTSSSELCYVFEALRDTDLKKTYVIATNDYLAAGNDKMEPLKENIKADFTGIKVRDMLLNYIKNETEQGRNISSRIEGRIVLSN